MRVKHKSKFVNTFKVRITKKDGRIIDVEIPNGITDLGLNKMLDVMFHDDTKIATWYIGLIDNAGYTAVDPTDTLGSHAGWAENTDYTGNRKEWVEGAASGESITNASPAVFAIDDTVVLKGIFVASVDTGTSGLLWSTALFPSTYALESGDTIGIIYTVTVAEA
jgi:hypothetical protein